MTTTWIVGGIAIACLVAVAVWRLRKASGTVRRILDEERAATEAGPTDPADVTDADAPAHRTGEVDG
jgi:FtsZ-interacting cell division protein ZipA